MADFISSALPPEVNKTTELLHPRRTAVVLLIAEYCEQDLPLLAQNANKILWFAGSLLFDISLSDDNRSDLYIFDL